MGVMVRNPTGSEELLLHLDRDRLYQAYIVEGLSTGDIARLVRRDPKRIWEKLRDFGIPTRPRGVNLKGQDNYMAQPGAVAPFKGKTHTPATRAKLSHSANRKRPWLSGSNNGMYMQRDERHPRWSGRATASRPQGRVEYKEWREAVIRRNGSLCFVCLKPVEGVEVQCHHVIGWKTHPEQRYNPNNGIVLCRHCHGQAHK